MDYFATLGVPSIFEGLGFPYYYTRYFNYFHFNFLHYFVFKEVDGNKKQEKRG